MNLIERLLDREILVTHRILEQLTQQQQQHLATSLDTMSDEQIEAFLEKPAVAKASVEVLRSYTKKPSKRSYKDFVAHWNRRLEGVGALLMRRSEMQGVQSIARLQKDQQCAIIGMVWEKSETKNGHIIMTVEDKTGTTKVLVSKNNPKLLEYAKDIMLDEVIGITGQRGEDIVFADQIIHPDIPMSHEYKKAPDEVYAIFVSDLHFGGKNFFTKQFEHFIVWLNGEVGNEKHRHVTSRIRYLIIPGDVIEGVGIYPGQERDLAIKDVYEQYRLFAEAIKQIPKDIEIIICTGNHDTGRLAEPQLDLNKDFTELLAGCENITFVSNPSYVRIHKTDSFPGFNLLLYHGYSFIYYGNNVPSIFDAGGVNKPQLIMKYLLQRRHLAPTHTSNLYIPDPIEDHLIIHEVPDFFVTGHTHISASETYRGVTMINCSCWVPITEYQKNFGLDIQPGRVHLVNLQTRQMREVSFVREEDYESTTE